MEPKRKKTKCFRNENKNEYTYLARYKDLMLKTYTQSARSKSEIQVVNFYKSDLENETMWTTCKTELCENWDAYYIQRLCDHEMIIVGCPKEKCYFVQCLEHNKKLKLSPESYFEKYALGQERDSLHTRMDTNGWTFLPYYKMTLCRISAFDTILKIHLHYPRMMQWIHHRQKPRDDWGLLSDFGANVAEQSSLHIDGKINKDEVAEIPPTPHQFQGTLTVEQRQSIHWMNRVECDVNAKVNILGNQSQRFSKFRFAKKHNPENPLHKYNDVIFWYDQLTKTFETALDPDSLPSQLISPQHISYNGGILANCMGSGKTITVLGKCLMDDFSVDVMTSFVKESMQQHPNLLPTLATLVVCPVGLLNEWKLHTQEFTDLVIGKDVLCIESKRDWIKIKHCDIIQARIVLISEKFMEQRTSYFCGEVSESRTNLNLVFAKDRRQPWRDMRDVALYYNHKMNICHEYQSTIMHQDELKNEDRFSILEKGNVILHGFFWRRIVFDEMHTFVNHTTSNILGFLKSKMCWGLTATPDLQKISKYMKIFEKGGTDHLPLIMNTHPIQNATDILYFTKYYIKRFINTIETNLPPLTEKNVIVEMTQLEFALYHTGSGIYSSEQNIARASHFALLDNEDNNKPTFTIHDFIIKQNKERKAKLDRCIAKANELKNVVANLPDIHRKNLALLDRNIQELQSQTKFFQSLMYVFEGEQGAKCDICYDSHLKEISVAPCGHHCCVTCYNNLPNQKRCIYCRTAGAYVKCAQELPGEIDVEKTFLGTKMHAILNCIIELTKVEEDKNMIIFFTQFHKLAEKMKQTLNQHGIGCGLMSGTDAHRRVIHSKWNQKNPVLIMTIEDSAAGLNLQKANHVILAHPLLSQSDENQAIGRAYRFGQQRPVTVWRYITKGTIEESIWENQNQKD